MRIFVLLIAMMFAVTGCLSTGSQAKLQQTVQKVCASGDTYHQAYNVWRDQGLIPAKYQAKAELAWSNFDRFCATPQMWGDPVGAALTAGTLYMQIQQIVKDAKATR